MSYTLPLVVSARFVDAMSILFPSAHVGRDYSLAFDGVSIWTLVDWELPGDPPDGIAQTDAISTFDWNIVQAAVEVERKWLDMVWTRCSRLSVAYPSGFDTYATDMEAVLSQLDPLAITWPTRPSVPSGVVLP